jgi:hypothetical protein
MGTLDSANCQETMTIAWTEMAETRQTLKIDSDPPLTDRGKVLLNSIHPPQLFMTSD